MTRKVVSRKVVSNTQSIVVSGICSFISSLTNRHRRIPAVSGINRAKFTEHAQINCLSTVLSDSSLTTANQKREQTAKELYIYSWPWEYYFVFSSTRYDSTKSKNDGKLDDSIPRVSPPEFCSIAEWPFPPKREVCEYFENFWLSGVWPH